MKAQTLLEMSGGSWSKFTAAESVFVLVDAQKEYTTGKLPLTDVDPAVRKLQIALEKAREKKIPVIHVVHKGSIGGLFDPTTSSFEIIDALKPVPGEKIVEKVVPNSFAAPTLDQAIAALGRKKVVLGGFMTHMCISTTARAALDLGYETAVLSDGVATRDLPGPHGETLDARTINTVALAELGDRFAKLIRTEEWFAEL